MDFHLAINMLRLLKVSILLPDILKLNFILHFELYLGPQVTSSPTNVGFYNRSYSSDQNNRSSSLSLNKSLTRAQ